MTETPQPAAPPPSAATTSPPPSPQQEKPPRLYRAAAWVVIVAGIVFTVAVIFFSGALVLGQGNALTTAITTTACSAPSVPLPPVQGWDGCSVPRRTLPGMGPGFLEARVARLLVRLVRVPPPRRRALAAGRTSPFS